MSELVAEVDALKHWPEKIMIQKENLFFAFRQLFRPLARYMNDCKDMHFVVLFSVGHDVGVLANNQFASAVYSPSSTNSGLVN
jgi:hypothetical protein